MLIECEADLERGPRQSKPPEAKAAGDEEEKEEKPAEFEYITPLFVACTCIHPCKKTLNRNPKP